MDERSSKFVKTLLNYEYTDVNKEGPITPLLTAVRRGDPRIVQDLLDHKSISVNQDSDQMTPLTEVRNQYSVSSLVVPKMEEGISGTGAVKNSK